MVIESDVKCCLLPVRLSEWIVSDSKDVVNKKLNSLGLLYREIESCRNLKNYESIDVTQNRKSEL